MASITNDASRAIISLNPTHRVASINRNIFSAFTEHMGRCIYGGLYDPQNPNKDLVTSEGFRKDVMYALRPLNIPLVRYPGGNFVATYHWEDGVGPKDLRPAKFDPSWECVETNHFGTDEFMAWCKLVGCEPYLCLNFGTGTLDEALGWIEYCNSSYDTYYANLRRSNGHPEPYNVKYWALGNENWGDWQVCQATQEAYAEKAYQWAKAIKLVDPSIQLILCGKVGPTDWDHHVLRRCLRPTGTDDIAPSPRPPLVDLHSIHYYTAGKGHYENATAPLAAERFIEVTSGLIDLSLYENGIVDARKRPGIAFDEWNVWDPMRAIGSLGGEEKYTLSDALAVAIWLNVFVRQCRDVEMACLAQVVNAIAPLMTTQKGLTKQTTWWPYELFCRYVQGSLVAFDVECGTYEGATTPAWLRATGKRLGLLDVSASIDDTGVVSLCVVNIHEKNDIHTTINGIAPGTEVTAFTITGQDVSVTNMDGEEKVGVQETTWVADGAYTFPRHSFTMLRWT